MVWKVILEGAGYTLFFKYFEKHFCIDGQSPEVSFLNGLWLGDCRESPDSDPLFAAAKKVGKKAVNWTQFNHVDGRHSAFYLEFYICRLSISTDEHHRAMGRFGHRRFIDV